MHYFETWWESWHFIPLTMCSIMFLLMVVCLFIFLRRRRFLSGSSSFRNLWSRRMFATCCGISDADSAITILKERYAKGEISKEEYDDIKKDITGIE